MEFLLRVRIQINPKRGIVLIADGPTVCGKQAHYDKPW